jgi:hypothetical protein
LKNIASGNPQDSRIFYYFIFDPITFKNDLWLKKRKICFESEEKMITFEQNIPALIKLSERAMVGAPLWGRVN